LSKTKKKKTNAIPVALASRQLNHSTEEINNVIIINKIDLNELNKFKLEWMDIFIFNPDKYKKKSYFSF